MDETRTVLPAGHDAFDGPVTNSGEGAPVFTRGACLGRYILLEAIGSGGMGTIFSAYDPDLDRKVAVKVLHRRFLMSESRRRAEARLLREARAVARLVHPNVVTIYDVGEVGGCFFIAMELIEGQSLSSWLNEAVRPWQQVIAIFEKAGRGLAAAHRAGLVHRDFKPGNVMLARDSRVLVVDFGLASYRLSEIERRPSAKDSPGAGSDADAGGDADAGLSTTPAVRRSDTSLDGSTTPGTPVYMAPEQRQGQRVDARADQYSFCVSLHQALYGELPPAQVEVDPAAAAVPRETRPKVRRSGVPGRIHQALHRGLAPNAAARFDTLDDLLTEIGESRWQRRRTATLLAALLLALGLAVVLGGGRSEVCAAGEQRLNGVWDSPRQARLRHLISGSGRPYAAAVWSTVERSLDGHTRAWQEQYAEACEATHVHGEQSPEMLDRRMACLDERLVEVREVTDLLLLGDPEILDRAIDAVGTLGRLAPCRNRTALLGLPAPLSGAARQEQLRIRAEVAKARALEAAGRFPQVVEVATAALAAAEDLGDRSLMGVARYWLAMGVGRLGKFAELREHLVQASQMALATEDDELLALSLIRLVVTGSLRGDVADAEEWARLAESVVERLPGRADLEALLFQSLCFMTLNARQHEDALGYCRAVLEVDLEITPQQRAIALNNFGISLSRLGRVDEALATYEESLAVVEELYGDQHPHYAGTLSNVAGIYLERGAVEKALEYSRHALAVVERSYGPESPRILPELTVRADALLAHGRVREAAAYLQRAIDLEPSDPAHLAIVRFDLARTLWDIGEKRPEALDLAVQALDSFRSLGQPYEAEVAKVSTWLEPRQ